MGDEAHGRLFVEEEVGYHDPGRTESPLILQLTCALVEVALYLMLAAASLHLVRAAGWALSRGRRLAPASPAAPPEAAWVTVQLPLRNEPAVAEGALRSAAALAWPGERLELQVLDDSDDETVATVDRVAAELAASGVHIEVLRRAERRGYKAGALAEGLLRARGELILVLDADFRPEPALLAQLEAHLRSGPELAFVQARWAFRNERASLLTRLQAAILDALFAVEQARLSEQEGPVQFNGTAGLWRRSAIERAGGWATGEDALTEDLDLSFRAHEAGLRGVTLPELAVSTELPESSRDFRTQQARWVRGGALTLRALGRRLLSRANTGADARTMLGHLVRHARQPLLVAAALRLPLVALGLAAPVCPPWVGPLVLGGLLAATGLYLGAAARAIGRSFWSRALLSPALVALSMGLAPALSLAFLGGLAGHTAGGFVRTHKRGEGGERTSPTVGRRGLELARLLGALVAMVIAGSAEIFLRAGDTRGALAAALCALGCAWLAR